MAPATATIPIVFISGADPVQEGLVASLNKPGGNATGVAPLLPAMEGKRLGLLREVVPNAPLIGVLLNPASASNFNREMRDVQEAARAVGQQLLILHASTEEAIEAAFTSAADPVGVGLVASLNRPGGNVTGVSWFAGELGPKLFGLLHELMPNVTAAALLVNPNSPESGRQPGLAQDAARVLGWQLHVISASSESEIDAAFATAMLQRAATVIVSADPYFVSRRTQIVARAAHYAIPTAYFDRAFVAAGGLISYGNSVSDAYRRAGVQTGRLLKGARPNDLPVDRATTFELVINLKTAKSLRIDVPPTLLARADEVIE